MTEAPDLAIRRYDPTDRNAAWEVHDRAFRAATVEFYPELNRYLRRADEFFHGAGGEFLVATVAVPPADPARGPDGEPLGYGHEGERVVGIGGYLPSTAEEASVRPASPVDAAPDAVEVKSVRVDPDFQRLGVARGIVSELEARAGARGFDRVVLDTGVDMEPAQALYESMGYRRAGQASFYGFDLIYYEKEL